MLSKVKRDKARLYGLVRREKEATEAHEESSSLLHEVYGLQPEQMNIKTAKLHLLKGLWSAKFNVDDSIKYLFEAADDFCQVTECEVNYFSINCYLEIGNNYLKKDNR